MLFIRLERHAAALIYVHAIDTESRAVQLYELPHAAVHGADDRMQRIEAGRAHMQPITRQKYKQDRIGAGIDADHYSE